MFTFEAYILIEPYRLYMGLLPNTQTCQVYSAACERFSKYLEETGISLPISPYDLKEYLTLLSGTLGLGSVKVHMYAIQALHESRGYLSPVTPELLETIKGEKNHRCLEVPNLS